MYVYPTVKSATSSRLHGDVGEDNTTPLVMSFDEIEDPDNWIESGPHLMMMPKDPTSLDAFSADFTTGAPYVMFQGQTWAHLMIPMCAARSHARAHARTHARTHACTQAWILHAHAERARDAHHYPGRAAH